MSARERAEGFLTKQGRRHADWASADGLRGIGWALLDLADAIRETAPKTLDDRWRATHPPPERPDPLPDPVVPSA